MAMRSTTELVITTGDITRLGGIAHSTWEYIGADCLAAITECDGTLNPIMTRDEVIEVVIDANRLELDVEKLTHDRKGRKDEDRVQATRILEFVKNAPYDQLCAVLRTQFSAARYGM